MACRSSAPPSAVKLNERMSSSLKRGTRRVVSKRVLYVELDNDGVTRHLHYEPYLDYRPLADDEPAVDAFLERPECAWIDRDRSRALCGRTTSSRWPRGRATS